MILVTKTSDQTRQVCVCVCVFECVFINSVCVYVCVWMFLTLLTDQASTNPSNILRGCQSGTLFAVYDDLRKVSKTSLKIA